MQCARYGCSNDLPPAARSGRPRRYCSPACRQADSRARKFARQWAPPVRDIPEEELHIPASVDIVEQAARAVLELAVLASSFARISQEMTHPLLSARCEKTYVAIYRVLDEHFAGWDKNLTREGE